MMKKIKSIALRNFKFFYGREDQDEYKHNKLELNKNNLLLFGENGSGKSSIYWALYTFLQSVLKPNDNDIKKYFQYEGSESLKNRYAEQADESGIVVEFESVDGTVTQKTISDTTINTKGDELVKKTLQASDFLNYKYLSDLYDFRNSEQIDLFPMFERELFPFIDFEDEFTLHNGHLSGTSIASDWWKFISTSFVELPKNKKNKTFNTGNEQYLRFANETIPEFIKVFKRYLGRITQGANEYLQNEFEENFTINFNPDQVECLFNIHLSARTRDQKIHPPKIKLTINLLDDKLTEANKNVNNPHTYLNEAKLTAIALAIRFAMLDERGSFAEAASLLVLDDLLLSLDMSHRNTVLDIILRKTAHHQLFILTHDMFFFQMARNKIKALRQEDWEYIEMYSNRSNDIPVPLIFPSESYIGKAKRYLRDNEYEIAGNFLRKEAESFLKEILPNRYKLNDEGRIKPLGVLLKEAITFAEGTQLDKQLFMDLDAHREFTLNPSSHDSYDVPKFHSELQTCIETLDKLRNIEVYKDKLKKNDKLEFTLVTPNGENWKAEIVIHENMNFIKEPSKEWKITSGLINFKIYKNGAEQVQEGNAIGDWRSENKSLQSFYENWYSKSDKTAPEMFWDGITLSDSGNVLRSLI